MELTDSDRATIRFVISSQIEALQQDDAISAFSFASPDIKARFGTPDNFMRMVKTAYNAVYRPRSVIFESITTVQELPTQQVLLLDSQGKLVQALYLMQKQPESGAWKIAGCYLVLLEGESI